MKNLPFFIARQQLSRSMILSTPPNPLCFRENYAFPRACPSLDYIGNRLNRTYQYLHGPSGPMTCLLYWVNESFPLNTNSYKKIIRFYKFM